MVSGLANFGQSIFGQSIFSVVVLWLVLVGCVLCCFSYLFVLLCVVCGGCVQGPSAGPPLHWTPLHWTPLRRTPSAGPKISLLFFPLPPKFLFFSPSLLVLYFGVFEDRDPQMGLSGCRVKPRRPHQIGPPGLAHDSPRTPNVHI